MPERRPVVAILGASGLIGGALAQSLQREGFPVVAIARRFTPAQLAGFGAKAVTCPVADLSAADLARVLAAVEAEVVVNCLGVLQDGPRGDTASIHEGFVARLIEALRLDPRPALLVHFSVPGRPQEDATAFSQTKRAGEHAIAASEIPFVVLRPGFVIAPAAYGGSALVRALAAIPLDLPKDLDARPFQVTAMSDIARTVRVAAERWAAGERDWHATWEVCSPQRSSVGDVVAAFRGRCGGAAARLRLPAWSLRAGAWAGDLAARLGWAPPVRTTALREMWRGVEGRPEAWTAATGLAPSSLGEALAEVPATVQERWFGRLFLLKPVVIGALAVFWAVSGLIALTVAFAPATAILTSHGSPEGLARLVTVASSLCDIAVGLAIAARRTCRAGLLAGIGVSLFYMAGAALLTPELWLEPLGALVKTGPAIVLMVVALAILDER